MAGPFSDITETIFANKEVLSESYQPETILKRDEEIEEYRYALQDVLFGRNPENIMLYGKAGLGKTAVTTYMMEALSKEVETREEADPLHIHDINCNGKTLFMVVRSLVNILLPGEASPFPKHGLGTGDAFDELYKQLDRVGDTHLIVFDEIDHLDKVNTLLYELPRARSNGHITTARIGIIGISNNYTFRKSLSSKVKDTLMETEISFSPYDPSQDYNQFYKYRFEVAKRLSDGNYTPPIKKFKTPVYVRISIHRSIYRKSYKCVKVGDRESVKELQQRRQY